jgi:hypothetical protein
LLVASTGLAALVERVRMDSLVFFSTARYQLPLATTAMMCDNPAV